MTNKFTTFFHINGEKNVKKTTPKLKDPQCELLLKKRN